MYALHVEDESKDADEYSSVFKFNQPIAIPSYLIALAVGEMEARSVGPRSSVWAEPSVVDEAASEFANIDKFLTVGEELLGPYVWGIYDVSFVKFLLLML